MSREAGLQCRSVGAISDRYPPVGVMAGRRTESDSVEKCLSKPTIIDTNARRGGCHLQPIEAGTVNAAEELTRCHAALRSHIESWQHTPPEQKLAVEGQRDMCQQSLIKSELSQLRREFDIVISGAEQNRQGLTAAQASVGEMRRELSRVMEDREKGKIVLPFDQSDHTSEEIQSVLTEKLGEVLLMRQELGSRLDGFERRLLRCQAQMDTVGEEQEHMLLGVNRFRERFEEDRVERTRTLADLESRMASLDEKMAAFSSFSPLSTILESSRESTTEDLSDIGALPRSETLPDLSSAIQLAAEQLEALRSQRTQQQDEAIDPRASVLGDSARRVLSEHTQWFDLTQDSQPDYLLSTPASATSAKEFRRVDSAITGLRLQLESIADLGLEHKAWDGQQLRLGVRGGGATILLSRGADISPKSTAVRRRSTVSTVCSEEVTLADREPTFESRDDFVKDRTLSVGEMPTTPQRSPTLLVALLPEPCLQGAGCQELYSSPPASPRVDVDAWLSEPHGNDWPRSCGQGPNEGPSEEVGQNRSKTGKALRARRRSNDGEPHLAHPPLGKRLSATEAQLLDDFDPDEDTDIFDEDDDDCAPSAAGHHGF